MSVALSVAVPRLARCMPLTKAALGLYMQVDYEVYEVDKPVILRRVGNC